MKNDKDNESNTKDDTFTTTNKSSTISSPSPTQSKGETKIDTMEQMQLDLAEIGYAIVPGILNDTDCNGLVDGFWNFWKKLSANHPSGPIKREDETTWKNILEYNPRHGMLVQNYSIGHMQEIWDLRCHPNVRKVYENIWKTTELTVSYDGASTGLPPEITGQGWHDKNWLHLDQSPQRNAFECVQGWVTPLDVEEGDGTLMVLKGSHKLHGAFSEHFGLSGDNKKKIQNWFKLKPEHIQWYEEMGCEKVYIECSKGSMVLWDSRTVHAGRAPVRGRTKPNIRMVSYISMMPIKDLVEKDMVKKKKALVSGQLTSHWAAKNIELFPFKRGNKGKKVPDIDSYQPPLLTEEGVRLSGWQNNPEECPLLITDPDKRKAACLEYKAIVEIEWKSVCIKWEKENGKKQRAAKILMRNNKK